MTSEEYLTLPEEVKEELYFQFMKVLQVPNKMEFATHCLTCDNCFARLNEMFGKYLGHCKLVDEATAQRMEKASLN